MEPTRSPKDQGNHEEIIELLKSWGSLQVEYPYELLASRRASFMQQLNELKARSSADAVPLSEDDINCLETLGPVQVEYPPELLAARRASFMAQVEQRLAEQQEQAAALDSHILRLLKRLKSLDGAYPPKLLAARHAAFQRQLVASGMSLLDALHAGWQNLLQFKVKLPSLSAMPPMRAPALIAIMMLAVLASSLFRTREPLVAPAPTQEQVVQANPLEPSSTAEVPTPETICKPGYVPPLCLAQETHKTANLTFPGNGSALPAVAKDTLPGFSGVHKPAYLNDGLYGPGASWVSNSAYSWVKIDLGKPTTINTVTFGRDRLGEFNDRDPGQFVIAVALDDDVYADGNSSRDYMEYTRVYNSEQDGFSGIVAGPETVKAGFEPVTARFVKIIFANAGTAIDEVEVFLIRPTYSSTPTRRPKDDPTRELSTPMPSSTPLPTHTATPLPTDTPLPTATPTDEPTDTPPPTVAPTDTPVPTYTPQPTDTPEPPPTDTPEPPPVFTEEPPLLTEEPLAPPVPVK